MTLRPRRLELGLLLGAATLALLWPLSAYAVDPIALPALLLVSLAVALVIRRPEYGIALVLALGPLTRLEVKGAQPLTLGLPALAVGVLAYALLVARGGERIPTPRIAGAVVLFLLVTVASALQALDPSQSVGVLATLLAGGALFFAVLQVCRERRQLLIVAAGACGGLLVASAHGLIQEITGNFEQSGLIAGEVVGRVNGTFGHSNQYAGFVAVFMPLAGGLALSRSIPTGMRWLAGVAFVLALPALNFAYARGAVGGLVLGSLVWLAVVRPKVAWAVATATVLAFVFLAPSALNERLRDVESGDVALRSDLWGSALDVYSERPILGVGLNNFAEGYATLPSTLANASQRRLLHHQQVLIPPHSNNLYLNILAEEGIIGLAAFAILAFAALTVTYRGCRVADPAGRIVCLGLGAGLLTFALHDLLEVTLLDLFQPLLALLAVAAIFVMRDRDAVAEPR